MTPHWMDYAPRNTPSQQAVAACTFVPLSEVPAGILIMKDGRGLSGIAESRGNGWYSYGPGCGGPWYAPDMLVLAPRWAVAPAVTP